MRNLCGVIYENKKRKQYFCRNSVLPTTNLTIICCLHTPRLKSQLFMWMQHGPEGNNGSKSPLHFLEGKNFSPRGVWAFISFHTSSARWALGATLIAESMARRICIADCQDWKFLARHWDTKKGKTLGTRRKMEEFEKHNWNISYASHIK